MDKVDVCGVIVWYDESPLWLMAAITSIAPLLDHLVVVDGAYALFPGSGLRPNSPIEQSIAVVEACNAANKPFTLYRPTQPFWGNEVEKRQLSIDLALQHTKPDEGWILVFDADQVAKRFEPAPVRKLLKESDLLVGTYGVVDRLDAQAETDKHGLDPSVNYGADGLTRVRGLYRALPGLKYGPAHWTISAPTSDGGAIWLWGNPQLHRPYCHDVLDLSSYLVLEHRNRQREAGRRSKAVRYYLRRDETGIEDVVHTFSEGLNGEQVRTRLQN